MPVFTGFHSYDAYKVPAILLLPEVDAVYSLETGDCLREALRLVEIEGLDAVAAIYKASDSQERLEATMECMAYAIFGYRPSDDLDVNEDEVRGYAQFVSHDELVRTFSHAVGMCESDDDE